MEQITSSVDISGKIGGFTMKKIGLAGLLLLTLSLTGCVQEYQLSENETNIAAEYMAGILLAQDSNYNEGLLPSELKEDQEQEVHTEKQEKPNSNPGKANESEKNEDATYTLSEVIDEKSLIIKYLGYEFHDSYPEEETSAYFSLTPREGNQLLVASFSVENTSNKSVKLDLKKEKILYQLDIKTDLIYKPSLTLLENDLRYIDISIKKGKKETVLLVFEIPKEKDYDEVNLSISRNSKSILINLK